MGKKKSVVLMVLLTILIVAMSVITLIPFPVSGTQSFNPTVLQFDLGSDLGGGYYVYYYPEGVKTETEFKADGDKAEDYVKSGSLYLSKDEKYNLVNKAGKVDAAFAEQFNKAAQVIADRFEARGYSDYRVAVVDNYALRIELPASDDTVSQTLSTYHYTDKITLTKGTASSSVVLDELQEDGAKITDYISGFTVANNYKWSYLKINLTQAGKDLMKEVKSEIASSSSASDSSATMLFLQIGENKLTGIYQDNITDNDIRIMFVESNPAVVKTYEVLLNSALENSFDFSFNAGQICSFEAVYGENALTLLYIALGVAMVAVMALSIVFMGGFGVASTYASLSYLLVVANFFAFITGKAAFEVTLGSALIFLVGFVLMNVLQYHIYRAIKAEFDLGKTVESSVKGGYKKTLWGVVDIYAVALLGALSLLIGAAGLATLAWQAVICIVAAAVCNLLWARAISFTLLSASKNKYKYFRFVREDDDDE